jgi:hypothetical protein
MLSAIVILLVILILMLWGALESLSSIDVSASHVARAAALWERRQGAPYSEPYSPPPTPTKEEIEQQKRVELEQQQKIDERIQAMMREQAEGSGWQEGRIISHRMILATDAQEYEVVLRLANKTCTASRKIGSFYRDGESHTEQTLTLDTDVRCAFPEAPRFGLGLLLAESPHGRVLRFQLTKEEISQLNSEGTAGVK